MQLHGSGYPSLAPAYTVGLQSSRDTSVLFTVLEGNPTTALLIVVSYTWVIKESKDTKVANAKSRLPSWHVPPDNLKTLRSAVWAPVLVPLIVNVINVYISNL